ncbi:MAG TPA: glycosyltransferase [Polyangiaceae bacterium]|nr:glycosyltransferase [Polyangiaceae bacterium]
MYEVHIPARSVDPFADILGWDRIRSLRHEADAIRGLLGPRVVWNISSTAVGGGVAEMLRSLLRYARGLGINVRWLVFEGPPDFFRITKRVHNALHGSAGDGSPLGAEQIALFERVTQENAVALDALVRPDDVVVCHDPQTSGLVPYLMGKGARVVWRAHIGHERHDREVDRGWAFLRPYLERVPLAVFSLAAYAPPWLSKTTSVLPPNIDPFSAKNQLIDEAVVRAILVQVGLVDGPAGPGSSVFVRDDGSAGRVDRAAEVLRVGRAPAWDTPLVVQVSRWDAIKDPAGVLAGFAGLVESGAPRGAQLVLAGPSVDAVADDPEGAQVFADLESRWRALADGVRRSIHLALLPMRDSEENAAIVNALQRHAAVIVQKSLEEGFGLTVTEAMWKRRPVVASAVGGIREQLRDGEDGLLLDDPTDLVAFAGLLRRVLSDEALAGRLGAAAYERVRARYLSVTALEGWASLVRLLVT